jgi:catalase-peroxidase
MPFHNGSGTGTTNRDWWPNQLNLNLLHQHSSLSDPMGRNFSYAEFKVSTTGRKIFRVDDRLAGLVARRLRPLRPLFIRMAWHCAGTARRR